MLQEVTLKLASVPGVQAATSVGPVVVVAQSVFIWLLSMPAEHEPTGTNVGPVFTLAQVTCVKPFVEVAVTGVQLLATTPTVDVVGVQTVCVH